MASWPQRLGARQVDAATHLGAHICGCLRANAVHPFRFTLLSWPHQLQPSLLRYQGPLVSLLAFLIDGIHLPYGIGLPLVLGLGLLTGNHMSSVRTGGAGMQGYCHQCTIWVQQAKGPPNSAWYSDDIPPKLESFSKTKNKFILKGFCKS